VKKLARIAPSFTTDCRMSTRIAARVVVGFDAASVVFEAALIAFTVYSQF
jgi:hypothetical protein